MANKSANEILKKYNISNYGRADFLDIGAYQQVNFSDKTFATTASKKIVSSNITIKIPWGFSTFIINLDEVTKYLI